MIDTCPEITRWLELLKACAERNFASQQPSQQRYIYFGIGDFLLRHGRWFQPASYPETIYRRSIPKQCFRNSLLAARRYHLMYVEGYAHPRGGIPVHHAWCTDGDNVVDPTWKPAGTHYFGVVFPLSQVTEALVHGTGCVLDDWQRKHPLYTQEWNNALEKRV